MVPLAVVIICALWLVSNTREQAAKPTEIDFAAFGRLPVTFEGRIKPIDTLARTSLRKISDRQTYVDDDGNRQPAIRWLLDVITDSEAAREHKVFRIHNLDVLDTLGLEPPQGLPLLHRRIQGQARQRTRSRSGERRETKPEQRDLYARKILDLDRKLNEFLMLQEAFRLPQLRLEQLREDLSREANRRERYAEFPLPLAVPPRRGRRALAGLYVFAVRHPGPTHGGNPRDASR